MKIVHIASYYHQKLRYQEYYLVREQIKAGHEVIVITSERNWPVHDYENVGKPMWGERIMKAGTFKGDFGETIIRLPVICEIGARTWLKGMKKQLLAIMPDIAIFHGVVQFHTMPILYSNLHKQMKIIVDEHSVMNDYVATPLKRAFFKLWGVCAGGILTKRSDKIVAIADNSVVVLKELYLIDDKKVEMIPLGVDTDLFQPNHSQRVSQRKSWGIDEDALVVLYTGKISPYKYVHLTMDVMSSIATDKKVHLVFVGNISDDYKETLKASQLACPVPCHFYPSVNQELLPLAYNAADVVVWPAHQTISTIEASSCGRPIICSDFLTERYQANNGFGIETGNIDELRVALSELINNDELRSEMGKNGRKMVVELMSWAFTSNKFISFNR